VIVPPEEAAEDVIPETLMVVIAGTDTCGGSGPLLQASVRKTTADRITKGVMDLENNCLSFLMERYIKHATAEIHHRA
jgi:hypothetical protein